VSEFEFYSSFLNIIKYAATHKALDIVKGMF